jgi:hypothetical protein
LNFFEKVKKDQIGSKFPIHGFVNVSDAKKPFREEHGSGFASLRLHLL